MPLRQGARAAALRARRLVLRQAVRRAAALRAPLPAALPPGRLPALRPLGARGVPGAATRLPRTVLMLITMSITSAICAGKGAVYQLQVRAICGTYMFACVSGHVSGGGALASARD